MKSSIFVLAILASALTACASPVNFEKRRFGVEHTPEADATFQKIKDCVNGTNLEAPAGNLSGAMVRALLAKAPACDQQDNADQCLDIMESRAKITNPSISDAELQKCKDNCVTYRQLERNTPNAGQPSELCTKAPKHKELEGLVQAQDPTGPTPPAPSTTSKPNKKKKKNEKTATDNPTAPTSTSSPSSNSADTNPVGGVKMPLITKNDDGSFTVNGNSFKDVDAAHGRQCDIQHNLCFNKFNGAGGEAKAGFPSSDCDTQNNDCKQGPPVFSK